MNNFHRFQNFRQFSNLISNLFSQIRLKKRHTSLFSGICREIRTKLHKKIAEKLQNLTRKMKKLGNSLSIREKNVDDFWLKFWDLGGAKVCKSCGSRQELSNEYLFAKIGLDTAENEPLRGSITDLSDHRVPITYRASCSENKSGIKCTHREISLSCDP